MSPRRLTVGSLFVACAVWTACGHEPGGDPQRVVPGDVRAAAVAPSLAELQRKTAGFLAGIEGASGALDLLADRYGLDLRTPDGPAALGLDVDRAIAVFTRDAVWAGAASVSDPERFLAAARSRLERVAGARLAARQPEEAPEGGARAFDGPSAPGGGWHAALGVTADRIGLLVVGPAAADVIGAWNAFAAGRAESSFAASPKGAAAQVAAGADAVMLLALDDFLPNAPDELGLARGMVQRVRDSLPTFVGGIALSDDSSGPNGGSLALRLSAAHVGEGALPVGYVKAPGAPDALAKAFPKTTTGFLRLRFALDEVRSLPGFILDAVLPDRLPGLEELPLPNVSDLIDLLEGDVAVGLLGLDPKGNLAQLPYLPEHPDRALGVFHVALAARMHDVEATRRAFAAIASQLTGAGWTVAPIQSKPGAAAPYAGWSLVRDAAHYAVLIDDRVVVFIVGAGEVDAFLAVKEGRALSLASFAEQGDATVKQALGQDGATPLGLALTPLRLLRELAARGLPPYFLKIINDVRLVTATVAVDAQRLELSLEIAQ